MVATRSGPVQSSYDFLAGEGVVSTLLRGLDWSVSPLGDPETWPQSLRSVVGLMLGSQFPMFVAWGDELGFIYNDPYAEILGAKHPRALGQRFRDIWSEIWPDISPLIDAAIAGEATYRENLPLLMNRKGYDEQTWFTFSYSPVRDESGRVAGMFCACTETTAAVLSARRRDALLELDVRLRDVANTADLSFAASEILGEVLGAARVGYGAVDPDAGTIAVERNWFAPGFDNQAGVHRFSDYGSFIEDLRRGRAVVNTDVVVDPRTAANAGAFEALGIRAHVDVPVVEGGRVVGQLFVHSASPRAWTDEEVGFVREFAERTRAAIARRTAEQEVRESEARFRNMADHAPVMMWLTDPSGLCSYLNRVWYEFTGQAPGAGEGYGWLDAVHPDDRSAVEDAFVAANAERQAYRIEFRLRRADGAYRWAIDAAAPRFGEGGAYLGYIGSVVDIHERKLVEDVLEQRVAEAVAQRSRAEEALRQAQKMEAMGQLTGGVAHDFNNLLTPIVGSLDMLQRKKLGGEREQRLIAGAAQSAERAKLLVQRLLAFARRQPLQVVAVDSARLVAGMGDLVASTTGPQIKVVVEAPDGLPPAKADPNQLEMALLNLSVNARDAMPDGGTLRISVRAEQTFAGHRSGLRPGDYICLSVADTGFGMDDATLARAVEPFFSTKGVGKGTGLGLSMVHGLALQLGGALTIQSRPGLGTNVELWLPQSAGATESPDAVPDTPPEIASSGRALLVDDEELVRMSTADMLTDLGYAVVEATSAEEAMRLIDGGDRFDLLVTDHLMPGMTGTDLVRAIRSTRADLPALVVSGYAESEGIAPDLPRLTKPFRRDELASVLAQLSAFA